MTNLSLISDIQKSFETDFEGCTLEYKAASLKNSTIHCFFANIPSELLLNKYWIEISNFIAIKFQNQLENEFERWNIYLFFVTNNIFSDTLKYSIENDTFSNRKIVIAPNQEIYTIVNEHILNNDLNLHQAIEEQVVQFNPNPIIWEYINEIPYKKRVTDDIVTGLNQIIEKIKRLES